MSRGGMSLVEILVALAIFVLAFLPIFDLLTTSRRITTMAGRQVVASSEAQSIMEGLAALEPGDLPGGGAFSTHTTILADGTEPGTGSDRWAEVAKLFKERHQDGLARKVEAVSLSPDRIMVRIRVRWRALPHKPAERALTLVGLVTRKS